MIAALLEAISAAWTALDEKPACNGVEKGGSGRLGAPFIQISNFSGIVETPLGATEHRIVNFDLVVVTADEEPDEAEAILDAIDSGLTKDALTMNGWIVNALRRVGCGMQPRDGTNGVWPIYSRFELMTQKASAEEPEEPEEPEIVCDYYVDALEGDDGNDGASPTTALKTIEAVNSLYLSPGDVVGFRAGRTWTDAQLHITDNGTEAHPIVFTSYGTGAAPLINLGSAEPTLGAAIYLDGVSWVEVNGLAVRIPWNDSTQHGRGVLCTRCENCTITNCTITGTYDEDTIGILWWNGENPTITDNTISHCLYGIQVELNEAGTGGLIDGNEISDVTTGTASDWDAIKVGATNPPNYVDCTGFAISNNTITGWAEDAIDCYGASNVVIQGNTIYGASDAHDNDNQSGIKCQREGMQILDNDIRDIVGGTRGSRYGIDCPGAGCMVAGNTVRNARNIGITLESATDTVFENNTVYYTSPQEAFYAPELEGGIPESNVAVEE